MDKKRIYHSDPEIMGGVSVFTGTRVPVDSLIAHLKAGDSLEQFLEGFPSVSREQAEGFLDYALADALVTTLDSAHSDPGLARRTPRLASCPLFQRCTRSAFRLGPI